MLPTIAIYPSFIDAGFTHALIVQGVSVITAVEASRYSLEALTNNLAIVDPIFPACPTEPRGRPVARHAYGCPRKADDNFRPSCRSLIFVSFIR